MMTTGQIDGDEGTNGWWQADVLMSGQIADENETISWWRGDKFMGLLSNTNLQPNKWVIAFADNEYLSQIQKYNPV